MKYQELLSKEEWHQKCQEILERDKNQCQDCGCIGLHNPDDRYMSSDRWDDVAQLLNGWSFNNLSLLDFLNNVSFEKSERLENVKYTEAIVSNDRSIHRIRIQHLYGKAQFFTNHRATYNLSIVCDNIPSPFSTKGYVIPNSITIKHSDIQNSKIYCFEFNKELANQIHTIIQGEHIFSGSKYRKSEYTIGITYASRFIAFTLDTRSDIMKRFPLNTHSDVIKRLNVHHKYYILGINPWEYPDEALITLCEDCHKKRHQESTIPMYNTKLAYITDLPLCSRCGGSGYLPQYHHVEDGICFKCHGEGVIVDQAI